MVVVWDVFAALCYTCGRLRQPTWSLYYRQEDADLTRKQQQEELATTEELDSEDEVQALLDEIEETLPSMEHHQFQTFWLNS